MSQPDDQDKDRRQRIINLTLASVAGQVGFLTLIIVFVALFGGLWLDKALDTKPLFTIILLVVSMPVTLVLMFRVVRAATSRIKPVIDDNAESGKEELTSDEDS